MKIIHLLPDINGLHTKGVISALKKWENELVKGHQQIFYVFQANDEGFNNQEDFIYYKYDFKLFFKIIRYGLNNNKIVVHGGNYKLWVLLFFLPKSILKRINWICWGSQIDCNKGNLRGQIYYKIRYRVFKSLGAINFLVKEEIYFFEKNYTNKNKFFNDYFNLNFEKLKMIFPNVSIDTPIKINSILIGNNAHYVNNHFQAIDVLESLNFRTDITMIVSYGSKVLIEAIDKRMKKYFLGNYTPIDKILDIDKLLKEYTKIDAYIAYSDTQTGLFAIYAFLYLMKPIYLKQGSLMEDFMINQGFNYFYLHQIKDNQLIQIEKLVDNHNKIKNLINSEESFIKWRNFFIL